MILREHMEWREQLGQMGNMGERGHMGWREPPRQRGYTLFEGGDKWDTWDRGKAFGQRGQNG